MQRRDFFYELPPELIAQRPLDRRSDSRLLHLERRTGRLRDRVFRELPELLLPGDLLVLNDTRVIKARLDAIKKATGGRVEILLERILDRHTALAQLGASKPVKPGAVLRLRDGIEISVVSRRGDGLYELRCADEHPIMEILDAFGRTPLPPYIRRPDDVADRERYQTVYARAPGAVAAPTAGLHFERGLLERLAGLGIDAAFVTLHVGAGTFLPVRTERIEAHRMHAERYSISAGTGERIRQARERGGRIVACGTSVVRALEAAAGGGSLDEQSGETDIFIYPGYRFRVIDAMITNFHLPESTLLMLVAAFAGTDTVLQAYRHAIAHRYRFYSYGDAMLIT